jgi:hypothetical protein
VKNPIINTPFFINDKRADVIESVLSQSRLYIDLIAIDGVSTDGT